MAQVRRVLCFEKTAVPEKECPWTGGRDVWWADVIPTQPAECEPEWLDAEDPLFLLYTSGSTGNPKVGSAPSLPVRTYGCLQVTSTMLRNNAAQRDGNRRGVTTSCLLERSAGLRGADLCCGECRASCIRRPATWWAQRRRADTPSTSSPAMSIGEETRPLQCSSARAAIPEGRSCPSP